MGKMKIRKITERRRKKEGSGKRVKKKDERK